MKQDLIGLPDTVTTLATCVTLKRRDGIVLGFTDYAHDLEIDEILYLAQSGYTASAIEQSEGLSVDNTEITGALTSDTLTEADLVSGRYDGAEIEIFQINYYNPEAGRRTIKSGFLGEVTRGDHTFKAEIRGLGALAQRKIGDLYSETCRAVLGDAACRIDLTEYAVEAQVTAVNEDGSLEFAIEAEDSYYKGGKMIGVTGVNQGVEADIAEQTGTTITPFLKLPFESQSGDTWRLIAGCDHTFATCHNKFNNYLNFRGEPNIPGTDKVVSYPVHK